jgi:16S rRNA (uracil1498-N3)-methyltransferase
MGSFETKSPTYPRFYAPDLDASRTETTLSPEESHHLVRVMRLVSGDPVSVFDGRGLEFEGRVLRVDRSAAIVSLDRPAATVPPPPVPTTLVQAVLKGDKMDGVVRDATMVGVARVIPIITERTLVKPSSLERAHARERWQRVAVSSAKQCRRAALPTIDPPQRFFDWLKTPIEGRRMLLVEPSADDGAVPIRTALSGEPAAVACAVGPEGGWTVDEQQTAEAEGCALTSLGSMTLRADAVGLVAVSLIHFALDSRR